MQSGPVENYLKAIYELEEKTGIARTTILAAKLGIKAGTVSEMIKRLSKSDSPLITYKHHQGVRLTPKGRKAALSVIRRHRLLETFLHRTLALSWDEVHTEAEVLEHHLSDRVTDAMDRHLGFPRYDPHGEPIPHGDGTIIDRKEIRLSDIDEYQKFRVVRVVPESDDLLINLDKLKLRIGTCGSIVARAPSAGPITIRIKSNNQFVEHEFERPVADLIYVEPLGRPDAS
jgi:DtxR family Mn-dependent transcriptional regulator